MDRRDGKGLAELMAELEKLEGLKWMRILYAYPSYFSDELIDEIAQNPKVRQPALLLASSLSPVAMPSRTQPCSASPRRLVFAVYPCSVDVMTIPLSLSQQQTTPLRHARPPKHPVD